MVGEKPIPMLKNRKTDTREEKLRLMLIVNQPMENIKDGLANVIEIIKIEAKS